MALRFRPETNIKILVGVAVVVAIVFGATVVNAFKQADTAIKEYEHTNTQLEVEKKNTEATSKPEKTENPPKVEEPAKKLQESPVLEEKGSPHIPFTSKEVQPGKSETYVDTVGQCPFYEIVNEKGCTPPPDIECNADWSVCTYVGSKYNEVDGAE